MNTPRKKSIIYVPRGNSAGKQFRILLAMKWYRRHLHEGVAAFCREQGWVLDSFDYSPDLQESNIWDGLILLHQGVSELKPLFRKKIPIVTLAMDEQGQMRLPCVYQAQEVIGAMGATHFLERGYRRLLFFGYRDAISHARFSGFRREAIKQGASAREFCLPHRTPQASGSGFLLKWISSRLLQENPPFAVMAAHDLLGATIMDACRGVNLNIPQQVALLGVDNEEIICECAQVPLSSVDNDLFSHGYEAARLLGKIISGAGLPEAPVIIQPRRVIVRASSDIIATKDTHLASILQYVHDQIHSPEVNVKGLSARFCHSRRTLGKLFADAKLRPPGQVIHDIRLRRACYHLEESSLSINEVATRCGFSSARSFCRFFGKMKKCSPEAWRQAQKA